MSKVMKQYCETTGIKQLKISPYHPQTDGMVEQFNSTLNRLLRKLTEDPNVEWDKCMPYVLWAYRGMIYKRAGFFPYELLFSREMKMPLNQMVHYWKGKEKENKSGVTEYIQTLRVNMQIIRDLAYEKEVEEKVKQKQYYDLKTKDQTFTVGDSALVFRPTLKNKLLNWWQGPYPIMEIVTLVTYQADVRGKGNKYQTDHVNCMRKRNSPSTAVFLAEEEEEENLGKTEKDPAQNIPASKNMDLIMFKETYKEVLLKVLGHTTLDSDRECCPCKVAPIPISTPLPGSAKGKIKTLIDHDIKK